ncbi:MAG: AAA family ATPase [Micrococcales bacterium]|nr:AAA family ATPase [Micrococcales bacterium]
MLTPADPLPDGIQRVLTAGGSGSGKTTLAARISAALGIPHTEIDALHHGPGWTRRPTFDADVAALVAQEAWVTEWQYSEVRPLLLARAQLLVWLDLPRPVVMAQVVRRTLRRRLRREELWNGNLEPPLWTILTDREHIIRWAWDTHSKAADRVQEAMAARPDLPVVRLTSRADVETFVAGPLRSAGG